jgi:hypothetical protein
LYGDDAAGDFHDPLTFLVRRLPDGMRPWYGKMPYVTAPADARRRWRRRFPAQARLRVGLVWSGKAYHGGAGFLSRGSFRDPYLFRTLPFAALTPFFSVPNVDFYSLQHGKDSEELVRSQYRDQVIDLGDDIAGFAEAAAAMEQLDLVVTVDTAAAHLAGAIGRPTLLLLPFSADWRWAAQDGDFQWYPSVRQFCQLAPGDWTAPVAEANRIISDLALSRK